MKRLVVLAAIVVLLGILLLSNITDTSACVADASISENEITTNVNKFHSRCHSNQSNLSPYHRNGGWAILKARTNEMSNHLTSTFISPEMNDNGRILFDAKTVYQYVT